MTKETIGHPLLTPRAGAVRDCLAQLQSVLQTQWGGVAGARNVFEHFTVHGFLMFPSEWTSPLEASLSEIIQDVEGQYLVTPHGASAIQMHHIAQAMIERLVLGSKIDTILEDWMVLLSARRATAITVVGLWGVQVVEPIHFAPRLTLVSAQDVPATREREGLFQIGRWGEPIFRIDLFREYHRVSTAALLIKTPNFEVLRGATQGSEGFSILQELTETRTKAMAAIALSSAAYPVPNWTYGVISHPAIPYSGLGGIAAGGTFMSPPLQHHSVEETILPDVFSQISNLSEQNWQSLGLSIDRLARSRGQLSPADRAIDLGIAVESALLHGETGTGAKAELRNKVATRGAWLIGETPSERLEIFKILRKAYDARSAAVHSGHLKYEYSPLLDLGDKICTRIIRKLVEIGTYPNWDKVTLGHGKEAWT